MKNILTTVILFLASMHLSFANNQNIDPALQGAWQTTITDDTGNTIKFISILANDYISTVQFIPAENKFLGTSGGLLTADKNTLTITYEYSVKDTSWIGQTQAFAYSLDDGLTIQGFPNKWTRLDDGAPGGLHNAWVITGRERNGEMTSRKPGPRKTMKILSGTRFQWIAYNIATKQFMGSGGGTYTTIDGKYTEHIDFFSRDATRVGAALEFDYELIGDDWHHKGLSSKGRPIYEVWSPRND